jgi:hypothetical protein
MAQEFLLSGLTWVLAILSGVAGVTCQWRARRYYEGPTGPYTFFIRMSRLIPSNYWGPGPSLVRWQLVFTLIFVLMLMVVASLLASHQQFSRYHH